MEERRALLNDTQSKISSQEKLLKAEILELRHQRTTLEDRLSQLADDFAVMKAKSDSLTTLCRQMELARDEALEGQAKLRSEMKVMQQSVTATFRMETGMAQVSVKSTTILCTLSITALARLLTDPLTHLKHTF